MFVTLNLDELTASIREGIAAQTSDKNALEALAEDPSAEVRARVALNIHAADYTISKLKCDPDPIVQTALSIRTCDVV